MNHQCTLRNPIRARGIGLHSGQNVSLTLRPSPADAGIIFRRIDLPKPVAIPARSQYVADTNLSTSLAKDGIRISTVEHLLAAFAGLGIDNAYVDLDRPEVPIMDGSAAPFVFLIQSAGIRQQDAPKRFIRIKRKIHVNDGEKWVSVRPYEGFRVALTLDFEHPFFHQDISSLALDFNSASFCKEVARARTFGFLRDVQELQERQLAQGGSLENSVVVDDTKVLNEGGLRYPDEFVRHKILDAVGDLYLLGYQLVGAFVGHKSGHTLNNRLIQTLLQEQDAWEILTADQIPTAPLDPDPTRIEDLLQAC